MPRHREIDYGDPYGTPQTSSSPPSSSRKKKKSRSTEEQPRTPRGYNPSLYNNPSDPSVRNIPASSRNYDDDGGDDDDRKVSLKMMIGVGLCCILLLIALIAVIAVLLTSDDGSSDNNNLDANLNPTPAPNPPPTRVPTPLPTTPPPVMQEPTPVPATLLPRIRQRGCRYSFCRTLFWILVGKISLFRSFFSSLILIFLVLRCGIPDQPGFAEFNVQVRDYEGFDVDMCRAVAAAIFGDLEDRVEYQVLSAALRWRALFNEDIDILSRITTHTMERHVLESSTQSGYSFSVPYLYNGLVFGGKPVNVACADNFDATAACNSTVICTRTGTTHRDVITQKAPDMRLRQVDDSEGMYQSFVDGFCNVIAGEQFEVVESIVKDSYGYVGEYALGSLVHSKEPLCTVTRNDDPEWSDFVNWVMQALLAAEEAGITSRTANLLGTTDVFGPNYRRMFINAVEAVGNYKDIYERHLETLLPRPIGDKINPGNSGLIYSFPYGSLNAEGDGPVPGGTLEAILNRGVLRCGISSRLIFAAYEDSTDTWSGKQIKICQRCHLLFQG
jgi:general L-amino acid transport system substrate-binding protein